MYLHRIKFKILKKKYQKKWKSVYFICKRFWGPKRILDPANIRLLCLCDSASYVAKILEIFLGHPWSPIR